MSESAAKAMLLVEDSLADVYLVQRAVADCGSDIQLFVVPDGSEALAFLRKDAPFAHVSSPALIIVDLRLPTMHGEQVVREIRRLPAYQATPVVILSSAPKEDAEARCRQLGASAYVQKSLNFEVYFASLKAIVTTWLRPSGVSL
jgi:two-component system, chemotaxis family, response regulator Rcp1